MAIGENIKSFRKKQQYTQQQLADLLYVTPQAISQWERGVTVPDTAKLAEIAVVLHTTVNALTKDRNSESSEWLLLDTYFSAEHMYSRMTSYAEVEHLRQTFFALRFMREKHAKQYRKPTFFQIPRFPILHIPC